MNQVNHKDRAHSNLGASSAKRWMNCTASVELIPLAPQRPDSPFAAEGTCAHEVADICLTENREPIELVGDIYEGHTVTEEMAAYVQIYVDYVRGRTNDFSETFIEERFSLSHIDDSMFGTNDASVVTYGDSIEVIDLKYGKGVEVWPENNPQLLYYALGLYRSMPEGSFFETIRCTIVQPRIDNPIKSWETPIQTLLDFEQELKAKVKEVRENPDFCTGDWCKFCPAKAICPQQKKEVLALLEEPVETPKPITFPKPSEINVDEMVNILNNAKKIKEFVDAVEDYAKSKLLEGKKIPQYKLVNGRASRKLISESEFILEYGKEYGSDLYTEPKLKSVAQLEKVVGKKEVAPFVDITHAIAMVHESNKKPAIKMETTASLLEDADKEVDLTEDF